MTDTKPANPIPGTALITGAAKRIGRAIALDMAENGWRVAIHYGRSREAAQAVVEDIASKGGVAVALPADLSSADAVDSLVPACCAEIGAPTCLINNASEFHDDAAPEIGHDTWTRHMNTNLRAPVFLANAMARHLPAGHTGLVINVIDQRVWQLTPEFFSYTISKSALWTATRTLAQSLAPHVRVNAIGPGPVLQSVHQSDEDFAAESKSTLLGRGPAPSEIADAIQFLLRAETMTGQMIALDGGQHLSWNAAHLHRPKS